MRIQIHYLKKYPDPDPGQNSTNPDPEVAKKIQIRIHENDFFLIFKNAYFLE